MSTNQILIIGAGGIGTELLKFFYLTGTHHITLIDIDTISLTNLNRQFLFTKTNVNASKSEIAAKCFTKKFFDLHNIQPNITYLNEDITSVKFNVEFYQQFQLVFSCLDNFAVRSFVNKRCRFAKVPMIDGGSAGYLGQACYFYNFDCVDCYAEERKEIPVCNVRTLPVIFEHVVIWVKDVFIIEFNKIVEEWNNDVSITNKFKYGDSERIKRLKVIETKRKLLEVNNFNKNEIDIIKEKIDEKKNEVVSDECKSNCKVINKKSVNNVCFDNLIEAIFNEKYTKTENDAKLIISIKKDLNKLKTNKIIFNKDNQFLLDLLYKIAILRCKSFYIPLQPQQQFETILGNIVPVMATTNAIVASLMFYLGQKYLKNEKIKHNYFLTKGSRLIESLRLRKWNDDCKVCNTEGYFYYVNYKSNWGDFINKVKNVVIKPSVLLESELIYDNSFKDNLNKKVKLENKFCYVMNEEKQIVVWFRRDEKLVGILERL